MDDLQAGARACPPSPIVRRRGFFLRLCTANPFYAISAVLVFVGLRSTFDVGALVFPSWSLLAALAGYTLLLAGMAVLLVRYGNVWDDIRTLLVLVVLMFLVISVAFDEILSRDPTGGAACCVGGLVFAAVLSEGLIRGLGLEFPARFRVPYHLGLALFFLYPVAITPLLRSPDDPRLPWALFGFAPAAALWALTLLPAARRGSRGLGGGRSPWPRPLYPWVVFGVLGFGACARSYYLCLSAQYSGVPGYYESYVSTIFGPYFLVPMGLAVAVLMLESGLAAGSAGLRNLALLLPAGVVALALVGHAPFPVYRKFLGQFEATLGGSPAFLTLLAVAGFYAVAAARRIPHAADGLAGAFLALGLVGPRTLSIGAIHGLQPAPVAASAALLLAMALVRRSTARGMLGLTFGAVAVLGSSLVAGWTPIGQAVLGFHLAILGCMIVGAAFDDGLARGLRLLGAMLLGFAACCVTLVGGPTDPSIPAGAVRGYHVAVGAVAAAYGWLVRCRPYLAVAVVSLSGGLVVVTWRGYAAMRRVVAGLDQIVWGLLSFLTAAAISLAKAGAIQNWWRRRVLAKPAPPDGLGEPT